MKPPLEFVPAPSRFETESVLRAGGMGVVEVARRRADGVRVALKRPLPRSAGSALAMFAEEALLCSLVSHPNVARLLEGGRDEAGPFLAIELIEGVPLDVLMKGVEQRGARLPFRVASRVALDLARGLAAVHQRGIVHRDVSPSNVMVGRDGASRLIDFGIASRHGGSDRNPFEGKPGYVAPERLLFAPADARADLYALGVILWEMLSGRRLRDDCRSMFDAVKRVDAPAPALPDGLPARLCALVRSLLALDAAQRPPSAADVARALFEQAGPASWVAEQVEQCPVGSSPSLPTVRERPPHKSGKRLAIP